MVTLPLLLLEAVDDPPVAVADPPVAVLVELPPVALEVLEELALEFEVELELLEEFCD